MLCNEVKRVVYFFLDGSLGDNKKQDFKQHLDACRDCEERAQISGRVRAFVRRRLGSVSAPDRLKTRLTRSIRAFRNEWSASSATE